MNNRQNGRRRRGGGGNAPRPMSMGGGQSGNRLEVRVRGNASQLIEKYKQLARDAHQAGDRVAAEYYLQHADHYFRVLNDSRIRQEEMRARRGIFDPLDEEMEGEEGSERDERNWRRDDSADSEGPDEAGDPAEDRAGERADQRRDGRRDEGRRDEGRRDEGYRDEARRGQQGRPARPPRAPERSPERAPEALSDGEAALLAFGGAPPEPEGTDTPPAPRRPARTRSRRSETAPAEG